MHAELHVRARIDRGTLEREGGVNRQHVAPLELGTVDSTLQPPPGVGLVVNQAERRKGLLVACRVIRDAEDRGRQSGEAALSRVQQLPEAGAANQPDRVGLDEEMGAGWREGVELETAVAARFFGREVAGRHGLNDHVAAGRHGAGLAAHRDHALGVGEGDVDQCGLGGIVR